MKHHSGEWTVAASCLRPPLAGVWRRHPISRLGACDAGPAQVRPELLLVAGQTVCAVICARGMQRLGKAAWAQVSLVQGSSPYISEMICLYIYMCDSAFIPTFYSISFDFDCDLTGSLTLICMHVLNACCRQGYRIPHCPPRFSVPEDRRGTEARGDRIRPAGGLGYIPRGALCQSAW